ncbi:MAG: hypothetical protein R3175_01365 [Marinobacter sp.]|uniref:hypothetical protein n=1 Tax=Marinobacter sp. TaxID=50741 RepID=UPI00299EF7A1|nr:hypothetical protein [Marinobacter sp.]MDX1754690.1 hypothetical protein [Marinobacter sp.]
MKTATTYMQGVWQQDDRIALSSRGLDPVVQYIRDSTASGEFDVHRNLDIDLDQPFRAGQYLILSNEGLSCGQLGGGTPDWLRAYQDNASRMVGNLAAHTQNILITVRSPRPWIRSMHAQFLNEGGSGSATAFVEARSEFLLQCLDLGHLVSCYRRYFNNVRVVPYEYLVKGAPEFWASLSDMFDMPVPDGDALTMNPSLSSQRLYLLSCLNGLSSHMCSVLEKSQTYTGPEQERLVDVGPGYAGWLHRRFVEHAGDEELAQISEWAQFAPVPPDFRGFSLDGGFEEVLEENYLSVVESLTGDTELVNHYRAELKGTLG